MRRPLTTALVLDVVLVIVFAAIGRSSHEEGLTVLGVIETSAPFLAGLALGWLVARWAHIRPVSRAGGLVTWVCTVAGGMVVRQLAGEGTAFSFILVASIVLGLILLASRLVVRFTAARTAG